MGRTHDGHRGDAHWTQWLARLTRQRPPRDGREGSAGRDTPDLAHGPGRSGAERDAPVELPQSGRIAGCSERERQWLRFMRWRYLRGHLTEFPQHRQGAPGFAKPFQSGTASRAAPEWRSRP